MSIHCEKCGRFLDWRHQQWTALSLGVDSHDFCEHEPTEVTQNVVFDWGFVILDPWEMASLDYKMDEPPIKLIIRGLDGRSLMTVPL